MFTILRKEINAFLNSLIGYMVMIVFLTGVGLFFWVFPQTSVLEYGYASLETLFSITPFIYLFLIPAITMRTFAEEKQAGTIELLLTRPLTSLQIVLSKYFASLVLVFIALLPTFTYYYTVYQLGSPVGNIDSAAVAGSYIGLLLLGAVFCAIGIFASVLTDNQIVSFVLAVFLCFLLYAGFSSIAEINIWANFSYLIGKIGIDYHYNAMSKGLIDSRNVLYFLSVIVVFLYLTKLILDEKK
ncbi:MAG: gliding motility-associated ABC transporter permease subunit GldF [Bacteroidetes bacterium]|nr:MAG: gliding motility-associated ABC transporter permease subunit GldF [Bacteroidota bacterium]